MLKKYKSERAITLIALVVTIIILIILAGVSINLVLGDNGIITKAKEAKSIQTKEQEKEAIRLAVAASQMYNEPVLKIAKSNLEKELKNQLGNDANISVIENGSNNFTIKMNDTDRTYYVESTGNVIDDENILEISTAEELKAFRDKVNDGNTFEGKVVCLKNNITLDINEEWTPIGLYLMANTSADDVTNLPFKGTFDGRGYVIDNIYINTTDKVQGLFGLVDNGKILNVGIGENCNITGGNATAGVVGCLINESSVSNCYNKGSINGYYVGGITGISESSTVLNCYNIGNIEGDRMTGGIIGYSKCSTTINCYNKGNIKCIEDCIGGIIGKTLEVSTISNCYNNGKVEGGFYVGGITGSLGEQSTIEKSYNNATIIANSSSEWGNSVVGGICGLNGNSKIIDVYNIGTIEGGEYPNAGGIVGVNRGKLSNSYNIGSVSGNIIGGIVGRNDSQNNNEGIINNSYSLEDENINIYGKNIYIIGSECSEKSSDELKVMASTLGEAFKVDEENINQGYPILSWQ